MLSICFILQWVFVVSFSKRRRGDVEGGYHCGGRGKINRSYFYGDGFDTRFDGVRTLATLSFYLSAGRYFRSTEDFREATDLVSA